MLKIFFTKLKTKKLQKKFEKCSILEKQLKDKLKEAQEFNTLIYKIDEYTKNQLNKLEEKIEKSVNKEEIKELLFIKYKRIEEYEQFFLKYLDNLAIKKEEINKLKKTINKIRTKNPNLVIFEEENLIKSILIISEAFKKNQLSNITFQNIQKAIFNKIVAKGWDFTFLTTFKN